MADNIARPGPSSVPPPVQHQQFPGHINNNVTQHNNHPANNIQPLKMPAPGHIPVAPGTPGTPGSGPGPLPVPQTPAGAPPPGHPQFEVDLPPELLQQGWRKYWSRRENRPYFFNRATGETLWEMPEMPGAGFERNSDPLGINTPPPQAPHHLNIHIHNNITIRIRCSLSKVSRGGFPRRWGQVPKSSLSLDPGTWRYPPMLFFMKNPLLCYPIRIQRLNS